MAKKVTKKTKAPPRKKKKAGTAQTNGQTPNGQKLIAGTYDKVPAKVSKLVEQYVSALRKRQREQEKENTLRAEVIEAMTKADVERVFVDDDKMLVLTHSDKINIKNREDA